MKQYRDGCYCHLRLSLLPFEHKNVDNTTHMTTVVSQAQILDFPLVPRLPFATSSMSAHNAAQFFLIQCPTSHHLSTPVDTSRYSFCLDGLSNHRPVIGRGTVLPAPDSQPSRIRLDTLRARDLQEQKRPLILHCSLVSRVAELNILVKQLEHLLCLFQRNLSTQKVHLSKCKRMLHRRPPITA